jgi:hypothetical protein
MQTLTVGSKAYYDTFAGLIPCVVLSITHGDGLTQARLRLTAKRGAYRRGELVTANTLHAVPRNAVYTRGGVRRIGFYTVA